MGGPRSRRPPRPMPRPLRAWTRRGCCRRPTSRPSTRASGRRSRPSLPARSWMSTTRWPSSWGAPRSRTTCSRRSTPRTHWRHTTASWTDSLYLKPVPGQSPQEAMKAIDKMIVMGSKMDGAALQEAATAHAKAIAGVDAKGVLSQADFEAINTGLGKAIASVPTSTVMDVYNSMAKLVGSSPIPNYLFSKVNPQDALAAYNGLLEFKDVVKAAQR